MNTTAAQTSTFDTFANRDDFLGFGYIGGRRNALDAVASGEWPTSALADVTAADDAILARSAELGWDDERLFVWANSKDGRWFADMALGCSDLGRAMRHIA